MTDQAEVTLENFVVSPTKNGSAPQKQIKELSELYEARIRQMFTNTKSERDGLLKENAVLKAKLREALDESAQLEAKLREMREERDVIYLAQTKEKTVEEINEERSKWSEMVAKYHEMKTKYEEMKAKLEAVSLQAADGQAADTVEAVPDYFQKTWHGEKPPTKISRREEPDVNVVDEKVDDGDTSSMVINDAILISDEWSITD